MLVLETFAHPLLTWFCELFDPSSALFAKSQKLGLTASNSSRFAHSRGPFTAAGWVPQKAHNERLEELFKGLLFWMTLGLCIVMARPGYSEDICKILSPKRLAELHHFPVKVVVALHEGARRETFTASLNGIDITGRFTETRDGVRALVGLEDGLRMRATTDPREKINELRTGVKGLKSGEQADCETFFFVAVDTWTVLKAEGGAIQSVDGQVLIDIPQGALSSPTTIGMAKVPASGQIGSTYRLSPEGIRFNHPVTITMRYDPTNLPSGVTQDDLFLILDDKLSRRSENVEVGKTDSTVSGTTVSFSKVFISYYVNMGKKPEDIPPAGDFRLPVGDDSDPPHTCGHDYQLPSKEDLGEALSLLRRSSYPSYDYPEIRFNEKGTTNQWHVVTAYDRSRYVNSESGPTKDATSFYLEDEGIFSDGEDWIFQGHTSESQGLPVRAIGDGLVVYNGVGKRNTIVLAHKMPKGPVFSVYSYNGRRSPCAVGTLIRKGNVIGKMRGMGGRSPYLHYAIGRPSAIAFDAEKGDIKVAATWFMDWKRDSVYEKYYDPTNFLFNIMGTSQWDFDVNGNDDGWTVKNARKYENGYVYQVRDGVLSVKPRSENSQIESYPLKIEADSFDSVFARIKSNALYGHGKIFFATDEHPEYSEDKAVQFGILHDGEFHEYRVFMADNDKWKGNIVGVRIDLMDAAVEETTEIDFDYIRLGRAYLSRIPDSGQTKCYDHAKEIPCPHSQEPFYGQDAHYTINAPSYEVKTIGGQEIVVDHVRGLAWQRHDDGTKRTWREAMKYCENLTLVGYSDWRLPAKKELQSIMNYDFFRPAVNTAYFAYSHPSDGSYWSSTTRVFHSVSAWKVSFWDGQAEMSHEGDHNYVRAVRGRPLEFGHFKDNGNGTVTDTTTGLIWQQAENKAVTWEKALAFCENLEIAGKSDWRLPNIRELLSLLDESQPELSTDTSFFSGCRPSMYWTSTTHTGFPSLAWHVDFEGDGAHGTSHKDRKHYLRAVRGGNRLQ